MEAASLPKYQGTFPPKWSWPCRAAEAFGVYHKKEKANPLFEQCSTP